MTDKEFRRLSRDELIEIIYELKKVQSELAEENEQLRASLSERSYQIAQAGSIAEAAIGLSGVFEAAQAAADAYLSQVHEANEQTESRCARLLLDAKREADDIVARAQREADIIRMTAEREAKAQWDALQDKTDTLLRSYAELRTLLNPGGSGE